MQLLVMFAEVHCGNYSSQTQEEKNKAFITVLIHWHHVRGKHTHLKWHRMENCPQSPSGLGPAQYQISTLHEQYSCPHFKSLILLFFFWNLFLLSLFFCPASVGLIRRLAGPPSYCRLLRTPLSDSELWAPPSSLALVLKGFLLLEWVNMFSDTQPDEESRLGSWTAVDAVRRLPPIFKFPFCFQFSLAVDLHGVVLCCARTTLAGH